MIGLPSVKFEAILGHNFTKGFIKSGAIARIGGAQKRAGGVASAKYSKISFSLTKSIFQSLFADKFAIEIDKIA